MVRNCDDNCNNTLDLESFGGAFTIARGNRYMQRSPESGR
jgi:hypothetical protein